MTLDRFNAAVAPKTRGSWNLHNQFPNVDFFIMLSSLLGVTGSPGQANYTAGGAYQDSLARFRRSRGLPAVCIDLGAVQSVGYVAGNHHISRRLAQNGVGTLQEEEVHRLLDSAICRPQSDQIITSIKFDLSAHGSGADWLRDSRFLALRPRERGSSQRAAASSTSSASKLRSLLSSDMSLQDASSAVLGEFSRKIMDMFGTPEVDASKDLAAHGVDSLVAIELRNWVASQAGIELSILDLIQSPSLLVLAENVASRLGYVPKGGQSEEVTTNGIQNGVKS